MVSKPVYLDHHSTTPVDPRVLDRMLPFFSDRFGNAGSTSHPFGWEAAEAVTAARDQVAAAIGASGRSLVFTSGATESNNLAIFGLADRPRRPGDHIVSVCTEHKAVLDPLERLGRRGFEITLLPVEPAGGKNAGVVDPQAVEDALRDDTLLVSVMLANNEIGVLQSLADIGAICKRRGVLLHTDATQAVGRIQVDVEALGVDLLSCSAHKLYGPKGVGALYVRRKDPRVRLQSRVDGGGQEGGLRSGTLNVPGIVGFGLAAELAVNEMFEEAARLRGLRDRLYRGLTSQLNEITLNGPSLDRPELRLSGNLNCSFAYVDGEALMMSMKDLAVSSGSACTSANPAPSHVLRALGLSDDLSRSSLRFGLGRFNTEEEIDFAIELLCDAVTRLRKMSSMA